MLTVFFLLLLLQNSSTFCQAAQTSPETCFTNSQILDRLENRRKTAGVTGSRDLN